MVCLNRNLTDLKYVAEIAKKLADANLMLIEVWIEIAKLLTVTVIFKMYWLNMDL